MTRDRTCRVFLKGGQTLELRGTNFIATSGTHDGDFRRLEWTRADNCPDVLYLDGGSVQAVVVADK